jgi:hypothetical protein
VRLASAEVAEKVPQRATGLGYERRDIAAIFEMRGCKRLAGADRRAADELLW